MQLFIAENMKTIIFSIKILKYARIVQIHLKLSIALVCDIIS